MGEKTYQIEFHDVLLEFLAVEGQGDVALCPVLVKVFVRHVVEFVDEGADLVVFALVDLGVVVLVGQGWAGHFFAAGSGERGGG